MKYINLKERKDIVRLGIADEQGKPVKDSNGNDVCLEFDLGDIELPLRYNKCINLIKEAKRKLKTQIAIINKKKDYKGKELLSHNEQEKVKAVKQFYKDMEIAMDLFLGQGGTRKFLNGRKPYFELWDDISEALKPHMPKLKLTVEDLENRIKGKYKIVESDVLTND